MSKIMRKNLTFWYFLGIILLDGCSSLSLRNGLAYEVRETDRQSATIGVGVGIFDNTKLTCDMRARTPEEIGVFCASEVTIWRK